MARYRYGFRLVWRFADSYCSRLKSFRRPNCYDKTNQHGGAMPALPDDFSLTGKQAATILEKCSEAKEVTWDQLRAILATLSYLHTIMTGCDSTNWKKVKEVWEGLECTPNCYYLSQFSQQVPERPGIVG